MIGLGTQDNVDLAKDFYDRTGYTHTLLWDEGFETWQFLGFRGQPSSMLISPEGFVLEQWIGVPLNEVSALLV